VDPRLCGNPPRSESEEQEEASNSLPTSSYLIVAGSSSLIVAGSSSLIVAGSSS